ncbi:retinitis pigmentosa GTPase regulator b [Trichomycterus rosablanca]|uniref:retinitis pigmentosa GTPase regulator b n=1 Tax=Trichomycterus rosablanca TaxID=2290929 RepID=UPI002F35F9D6
MAGDVQDEIPESGAAFTFGKSKFADNIPSKFWLKNDVPWKVACGDEHTALITENGKLFVFGSNNWGQLGLGEKASVNRPTCVKALKSEKVRLVACGRTHTLVYTSQGNLYATGGNNEGQLGLGDFKDRTSFQLVDFFSKRRPIKMLAAGSNTSAALTYKGKLYVWGDNSEGQIGLGKEENTWTPQEISVGRRVAWISCGYYHSAFVTEDGALFTFGERDSGKLGLSQAQLPNHKVPQQVQNISKHVLQVACGGGHTVALTEDCLYSFGLGQFGQLGHGTFTFESDLPKVVEHFRKSRVKHIACGENHTAVLTESGLLYTFGDGRHGKLALGDENFVNHFKPTFCPRFLRYNVYYVSCGGCHMLVLAKPRLKDSDDVILEDDDATEVYLERSYTELLRVADTKPNLNRSLSARDRRREREHSPEQFGMMFRTLPSLSSGYNGASQPVSSKTLPLRLAPTEMHSKRATNSLQRNHLPDSTVMEVPEIDWKCSAVQDYEDNESVKDLGKTTDLLNLTHVMKLDAGEKTLALSPVQKKKVKAGKKRGKDVAYPVQDPAFSNGWAELMSRKPMPSELMRSQSAKLQFGKPSHAGIPYKISGSNKEISVKERSRANHKAWSSTHKTVTQPQSLTVSKHSRSEAKTGLATNAPGQSRLIDVVGRTQEDNKQHREKTQSSQVNKVEVRTHSIKVSRSEPDTEVHISKVKAKFLVLEDLGKGRSKSHQRSETEMPQQQTSKKKGNRKNIKSKENHLQQPIDNFFSDKNVLVQYIPGEAKSVVARVRSKPIVVQNKLPDDTLELDEKSLSKADIRADNTSISVKQNNQFPAATKKTTSAKSMHSIRAQKTTKGFLKDSIDCMRSNSDVQNTQPMSLKMVTSVIEDPGMVSPVHLLKKPTKQFLSQVAASNSSQTSSPRQSFDEQTLSDISVISEAPKDPENASKKTAVTIDVLPGAGLSDEESDKSFFHYRSKAKNKDIADNVEMVQQDKNKEVSEQEEEDDESRGMTESEGLVKAKQTSSSVESSEESKALVKVSNNNHDKQDDLTGESSEEDCNEQKKTETQQSEQSEAKGEKESSNIVDDGVKGKISEIRRKDKSTSDYNEIKRIGNIKKKGSSKESSQKTETQSGKSETESEVEGSTDEKIDSEEEVEGLKSQSDSEDEQASTKESATKEAGVKNTSEEEESESKLAEEEEGEEWESGNESQDEERSGDAAEDDSEKEGEESEADQESDAEEAESKAKEKESGTDEEESGEEESEAEESETDKEESEAEEEHETDDEESEGEEEECSKAEEESDAEKESENEAEVEESEKEEEECEEENEENVMEECDEEDEYCNEEVKEEENDTEDENEHEQEEEDGEENEEDEGKESEEANEEEEEEEEKKTTKKLKGKDKAPMTSKSKQMDTKAKQASKPKKARKGHLNSDFQEPLQFWDNVLPHYLNLK